MSRGFLSFLSFCQFAFPGFLKRGGDFVSVSSQAHPRKKRRGIFCQFLSVLSVIPKWVFQRLSVLSVRLTVFRIEKVKDGESGN
jgi:hypothetical protein